MSIVLRLEESTAKNTCISRFVLLIPNADHNHLLDCLGKIQLFSLHISTSSLSGFDVLMASPGYYIPQIVISLTILLSSGVFVYCIIRRRMPAHKKKVHLSVIQSIKQAQQKDDPKDEQEFTLRAFAITLLGVAGTEGSLRSRHNSCSSMTDHSTINSPSPMPNAPNAPSSSNSLNPPSNSTNQHSQGNSTNSSTTNLPAGESKKGKGKRPKKSNVRTKTSNPSPITSMASSSSVLVNSAVQTELVVPQSKDAQVQTSIYHTRQVPKTFDLHASFQSTQKESFRAPSPPPSPSPLLFPTTTESLQLPTFPQNVLNSSKSRAKRRPTQANQNFVPGMAKPSLQTVSKPLEKMESKHSNSVHGSEASSSKSARSSDYGDSKHPSLPANEKPEDLAKLAISHPGSGGLDAEDHFRSPGTEDSWGSRPSTGVLAVNVESEPTSLDTRIDKGKGREVDEGYQIWPYSVPFPVPNVDRHYGYRPATSLATGYAQAPVQSSPIWDPSTNCYRTQITSNPMSREATTSRPSSRRSSFSNQISSPPPVSMASPSYTTQQQISQQYQQQYNAYAMLMYTQQQQLQQQQMQLQHSNGNDSRWNPAKGYGSVPPSPSAMGHPSLNSNGTYSYGSSPTIKYNKKVQDRKMNRFDQRASGNKNGSIGPDGSPYRQRPPGGRVSDIEYDKMCKDLEITRWKLLVSEDRWAEETHMRNLELNVLVDRARQAELRARKLEDQLVELTGVPNSNSSPSLQSLSLAQASPRPISPSLKLEGSPIIGSRILSSDPHAPAPGRDVHPLAWTNLDSVSFDTQLPPLQASKKNDPGRRNKYQNGKFQQDRRSYTRKSYHSGTGPERRRSISDILGPSDGDGDDDDDDDDDSSIEFILDQTSAMPLSSGVDERNQEQSGSERRTTNTGGFYSPTLHAAVLRTREPSQTALHPRVPQSATEFTHTERLADEQLPIPALVLNCPTPSPSHTSFHEYENDLHH